MDDRQKALEDALDAFFTRDFPLDARRARERALGERDAPTPGKGLDRDLWRALARTGVLSARTLRHVDAAVACEHMGRALFQSPYQDVVAVAELALAAERSDLVDRIASGDAVVVLATRARGDDDPAAPRGVDARPSGGASRALTGRRRFVSFARDADLLVVPAGSSKDLYLVPTDRAGVRTRRHDETSRGELYDVTFDDVEVGPGDVLLSGDDAARAFGRALAHARVRQACFVVGMARGSFEAVVAYTKRREQFGQKISRFQALAFRMAALAARIDGARLLAQQTAWRADRGDDVGAAAAQALALAADVVRDVVTESIQMHGAVGVTERLEPSRYYRHAAVEAQRFGTVATLRAHAAAHYASPSGDESPPSRRLSGATP